MSIDQRPITRALVSVSDKSGLIELAQALRDHAIAILSTGGTYDYLKQAGFAVTNISDITQFPEMMDGRLKTLHPKVHGGLLAIRENPEHEAAALAHNIEMIDLLVVNLYPFEAKLRARAPQEEIIENIDIGGPAMIRAAAKNHADVAVIVDPKDYQEFIAHLNANHGATQLAFRRILAQKAFARSSLYDAAVANWFAKELDIPFPLWRTFGGELVETMRYGENPHQTAALYRYSGEEQGVAQAHLLQGKPLSYNNINDAAAALECVAEFSKSTLATAIIVKHANPCGVAQAETLAHAYINALACDSVSAFGGIIALNRALDGACAKEIVKIFTEVILAPGANEEALAILATKPNLRLLTIETLPDPSRQQHDFTALSDGFMVQSRDNVQIESLELKVVTKRAPSTQEWQDLTFAFRVAKHVKSNAIVYAKNGATVGIGAGQMSRVDSARIAAWKSAEAAKAKGETVPLTRGSVVASDAFFPFADGLEAVIKAGASAVIQPGGSMRDPEVIAAADKAGIAMVFTGIRNFRH